MKTFLKLIGLMVLMLLLIAVGRTLLLPSRQTGKLPYTPEAFDSQRAARNLSGAIAFPTISWEGGGTPMQQKASLEAFAGLHAYLEKTFPRVYAKLGSRNDR